MTIVNVTNLVKVYQGKTMVPVRAVDGVDLVISTAEFTAIAGPSGSGKTTLLNIIGGIDIPTSGQVLVNGQDLSKLNGNKLADFRLHNIGFIFQAYNLIPVLTATENVEFIMLMQGVPADERQRRIREELSDFGIESEMMNRRPAELSGGQQQRIAIARATVARPNLILADEPTANLDSQTGSQLLDKMSEMNQKRGITFIFSTHDPMVMERAKRLIRVQDGKIISDDIRS